MSFKSFIKTIPIVGDMVRFAGKYATRVPAGHYYSPIVSVKEIRKRELKIYPTNLDRLVNNIDLNEAYQFDLLKTFSEKYFNNISFKKYFQKGSRYYSDNNYYIYPDATILCSIMQHFKPKRIIEAGSGFSSAVMLDINEFYLNNTVQFSFIEPYPDRLYSLLTPHDKEKATIIVKDLQDVEISFFEQLQANDILFIDSTHVSKTGSDVNYFLFEIFPILKPGVLIHIHDIFYPFEYPKEWVIDGNGRFGWNEAYLLRAFLMNQKQYQILFFTDFMQKFYADWIESNAPALTINNGRAGGIWLKKNS